uniref:Uncharacterized protein n=1 Tax=Arundo donax TaxID=35708 RepID=A0A0A9BUL4_ARUDO
MHLLLNSSCILNLSSVC